MATEEPAREVEPRIETYRFHEREWDGYGALYDAFEWEIPAKFNAATYCCDRWAEADPDRVALHAVEATGEREYTYADLRSMADRLANHLRERGVGRGDRVGVSGAQKIEFVAAHLAVWKLGAVTVPLSLLFGPDGLGYRLRDSGASAFVADAAALEALREVRGDCRDLDTVLTVDAEPREDEAGFHAAIEGESEPFETRETGADEPAAILYTSGTTGPPKGTVHGHRFLLGTLVVYLTVARDMNPATGRPLYSPVEWSWVATMYVGLLSSLYYGGSVVADANPEFDPERTLGTVERYGVGSLAGPTTVYRMLMEVPGIEQYDLSSLDVAVQGGEALDQAVVEWLRELVDGIAVHEAYGQTEAGVFVGDCEALGIAHEPGHVGKPLPGSEVAVIGPERPERVPDGEVGEIALRYEGNPMAFLEYWNAPEKTAAVRNGGWHRTGDLGTRRADGFLSFHSRKDDVIVTSGYRVGPDEIEETLAGHEAVAVAGVIGVPHDERGEVPKAFVVPGEGYEPDDALRGELQGHVKERLAKYEYPRELAFVEELPRTTTGKVRRQSLREREGLAE
ncbi:acyl-CoA synthetase [Salinirubellus sp. GCM10025818]|uniref:acyl-CoA synthetase n=1 Tax=Salinirubellus TaxID=2162630 RepID=UPI0030D17BD5